MTHEAITTAFEHSYVRAIEMLLDQGRTVKPRGFVTKEITPFMLGFENARKRLIFNPERKVNIAFMLAECLWIMNGRQDVDMVSFYNSKIASFSDDGQTFHGAYGPRLRSLKHYYRCAPGQELECDDVDQFQQVIDKLKEDPDSRQAVCNIFLADRDFVKTKDVPCTLTFQFFRRKNFLGKDSIELVASMRSNDVILGLSTDAFNFSMIQELIASELELDVGYYYHVDGSLHIYERDFEWAHRIVNSGTRKVSEILEMAPMPVHSLQHIKRLGVLEEKLRTKGILERGQLPDYWEAWLLTFACYKALKLNDLESAKAMRRLLNDHPFTIFLQRSINRKEKAK